MAGATNTFDIFDELVFRGRLGERLQAWRADGLSYPQIAERLFADYHVKASPSTVCRWLQRIEETP